MTTNSLRHKAKATSKPETFSFCQVTFISIAVNGTQAKMAEHKAHHFIHAHHQDTTFTYPIAVAHTTSRDSPERKPGLHCPCHSQPPQKSQGADRDEKTHHHYCTSPLRTHYRRSRSDRDIPF